MPVSAFMLQPYSFSIHLEDGGNSEKVKRE